MCTYPVIINSVCAGPEVSSSWDGGPDKPGLLAVVPADERCSRGTTGGEGAPSDPGVEQ